MQQSMNVYRHPEDNTTKSIARMIYLMDTIPEQLRSIPEKTFSHKSSPEKWSYKEIIGHLIDSATNNHHRFVRAQFEDRPTILYDQNQWNAHGYHQLMDQQALVSFWEQYNRHIAALFQHIPEELRNKECTMGDGNAYSIAWLFDDYVRHLEHHLGQISF